MQQQPRCVAVNRSPDQSFSGESGNENSAAAIIAKAGGLCHNAAAPLPGRKGCRGGGSCSSSAQQELKSGGEGVPARGSPAQESQMPKMKTKSGAKKRFKITGTGKVISAHAGKRHGMIKRTNKQIRQLRGTRVMFKADGDNIKKFFLPNG
jgi:large subunit ribosomal protein L35